MTTPRPPSPAERAIRRRIARHGPITFAEYMSRALYGPGGYYTRGDRSPVADYYTSPQVHPGFGALLSVQLFHIWTLLEKPARFVVVEPGAGDGLLCCDILSAAEHLPDDFGRAIRYIAVDRRSAPGREPGSRNCHRIIADALRLPLRGMVGCVLSNELLDALPVHRVRMENEGLRELYVDLEADVADGYEGALVERPGQPSTPRLAQRLATEGVELALGQIAEVCLSYEDWAASAAGALEAGFVLTIDYGRAAADLYDPSQRPNGTLVTYRGHSQTDTPLVDAGRQDITSQVDFTALRSAGEQSGLRTVGNLSQARFLQSLGLQTLRRNGPPQESAQSGWITIPVGPDGALPGGLPEGFGESSDAGRDWLTGLTHLVRPGGLGDFRVLVQAKGVPATLADQSMEWLVGSALGDGYGPSSLAAMIPPDALRLDHARLRLLA